MNELQKGEILDWKSKPSSLWRLHAAPSRSKPLQAQATVSLAGEQLLIIFTIVKIINFDCIDALETIIDNLLLQLSTIYQGVA